MYSETLSDEEAEGEGKGQRWVDPDEEEEGGAAANPGGGRAIAGYATPQSDHAVEIGRRLLCAALAL